MQQQIDWMGLVAAVIAFLSAVTLALTLWNQRKIAEVKSVVHEINGNIQAQLDQKKDKP